MKKMILLLSSVILTTALYGQAVCDGQQVVLSEGGTCNYNPYVLVFEDNFDGNSLDLSKWQIQPWGQGALSGQPNQEYNSLDNVEVSNGTCKTIAKNETVVRKAVNWKPDNEILEDGLPNLRTYYYTSSCIWTNYKFGHGMFEIRCKLPKGKGFWPAFWTFGGPGWNEIDVFEFWNETDAFGNYDPSKLSKVHKMNAHYDYDGDGNSENCPTKYTGPDFSQAFHTFTVIWTPYKIEWYVDGDLKRISTLFCTMLGEIVDCNGLQAFHQYILDKAFPRQPMHIIFGMGIQSGSNAPDANTPFPSSLEIDYIRYYKQMPCDGSIDVTDISSLNLSPEVYNVIIGSSINLSGNFTVQSGQQLEVIASDEIILGPGFTAEAGSNFVARIDDGICIGTNKMAVNSNSNDTTINNTQSSIGAESNEINSLSVNERKDCNVKIFPNPSKGKITIEITTNSANNYEIYLIDIQGKTLFTQPSIVKSNIEIDISNYGTGTYFLNIIDIKSKNAYSHKIIKK